MRRLIPASIAFVALAFAASAIADVVVYKAGFGQRSDVREIDRFQGGKPCKKSWKRKKALGVSVQGRRACRLKTPVQGDRRRPDHGVQAAARVVKRGTDRRIRNSVYIGAALRVDRGGHYELRVFPKTRNWALVRNGDEVAAGRERAIAALGKRQTIRLVVSGRNVSARVNGKNLTSFRDPNPDQLDGRGVALSFGSTSRRKNPVGRGVFNRVRVLVPDP